MTLIHSHWLMHLAAFIGVAALALRDQLRLRSVLLVSLAIGAVNNVEAASSPDWEGLFWTVVSFAINLAVLVRILLDRTHIGLSTEEEDLFGAFAMLTPGEFRAFVALATWHTAETVVEVTREGETPDCLYYVLQGGVTIEKGGRATAIAPRTFIGEVAFLHRRPASATVRLEPGSRYLAWPVRHLDRRIQDRPDLKHAVMRLISFDMALKVARS